MALVGFLVLIGLGGCPAASEGLSDQESVAADKAALVIGYAGTDSAASVTQALTLPTSGDSGTVITWASGMTDVIDNAGTVTRPDVNGADTSVTLTATITKNNESDTQVFFLQVLKALNDADSVAADKAALVIGYAGTDNENSVTQDLTLPGTGSNGTTIAWASSVTAVIDNAGTVTRPAADTNNEFVTLTATITKNSVSDTKTFTLTVKKEAGLSDADSVAADKAALVIGYAGTDSAASVTQALTLPTSGDSGTVITWASGMTDVIDNAGTVTRPDVNGADTSVTLTATITKNNESDTQVFFLQVLKALNDADSVAADKAALVIGYAGTDNENSVTQDLTLPGTGSNGTTIAWASSVTAVIDNAGTVTRPAADTNNEFVTLTATITKNSESDTKTFTLTVKKALSDADSVAADKAALVIGYAGTDNENSVTQDLTLPGTGSNGTTIEWASNVPGVIDNAGTVTRPAADTNNEFVTLTATITKNNESDTQVFFLQVLKESDLSDADSVAADKAALVIGYAGTDNENSVTQDLTLPGTGSNGTTIAWASSVTAVIDNAGTVTRPAADTNNEFVTLTATITKNSESDTKTFTLTVKKALSDADSVAADKAALVIGYAGTDNENSVTQDLTLPGTGSNGTTIEWASNVPGVIDNAGTVTRPAADTNNEFVTLTATITKNNESDTQVFFLQVLKESDLSDADSVAADKAALVIGYAQGDDASSVTQDLTLPGTESSGTTITWASDVHDVIDIAGAVTRPAADTYNKLVTLTATIEKNGVSDTKIFTLTVLKEAVSNADSVMTDKAALVIGYAGTDNENSVTQDLTLPGTGSNGTTIEWASNVPGVIDNAGTVTRPDVNAADATVTLTATIKKNGESGTKTFTLTVLKALNDADSVAADQAALVIGYAQGDDASSVTQDLTLPGAGASGTVITWSSDKTAVITVAGVVTRPAAYAADESVTLTATITKNGVTATKAFTPLVVKALKQEKMFLIASDGTDPSDSIPDRGTGSHTWVRGTEITLNSDVGAAVDSSTGGNEGITNATGELIPPIDEQKYTGLALHLGNFEGGHYKILDGGAGIALSYTFSKPVSVISTEIYTREISAPTRGEGWKIKLLDKDDNTLAESDQGPGTYTFPTKIEGVKRLQLYIFAMTDPQNIMQFNFINALIEF